MEDLNYKNENIEKKYLNNMRKNQFLIDYYSRIGGKMKIQLEKPALNNSKAYGWQK